MVVGLSFAPEHRIGPLLAPIAKIGGLRGLLPAGHRGPWLPLLEALAERGCRCPVSAGGGPERPVTQVPGVDGHLLAAHFSISGDEAADGADDGAADAADDEDDVGDWVAVEDPGADDGDDDRADTFAFVIPH